MCCTCEVGQVASMLATETPMRILGLVSVRWGGCLGRLPYALDVVGRERTEEVKLRSRYWGSLAWIWGQECKAAALLTSMSLKRRGSYNTEDVLLRAHRRRCFDLGVCEGRVVRGQAVAHLMSKS